METHFNQTTHIHSWTGRWPVAAEPSAICITRFILHLFRTFFHSPVTTSELSLSSVSSLTFSTPISQKALPCYYFFLLSFSWFVFSFSASLSLIVMLLLFLFLVSRSNATWKKWSNHHFSYMLVLFKVPRFLFTWCCVCQFRSLFFNSYVLIESFFFTCLLESVLLRNWGGFFWLLFWLQWIVMILRDIRLVL